ncbi:hypothetical protein ADUPG1_007157 [Aduncisulcus paluster]|uniref:Uncharacterized protein n=1 Tax=Aduncisulcus paluster TaxID=2918883 RepID=A0ABQ5KKW9_9EUKA|nr:hypothetical protein ADUPG1_007157 [Aduncisulcus paluster]
MSSKQHGMSMTHDRGRPRAITDAGDSSLSRKQFLEDAGSISKRFTRSSHDGVQSPFRRPLGTREYRRLHGDDAMSPTSPMVPTMSSQSKNGGIPHNKSIDASSIARDDLTRMYADDISTDTGDGEGIDEEGIIAVERGNQSVANRASLTFSRIATIQPRESVLSESDEELKHGIRTKNIPPSLSQRNILPPVEPSEPISARKQSSPKHRASVSHQMSHTSIIRREKQHMSQAGDTKQARMSDHVHVLGPSDSFSGPLNTSNKSTTPSPSPAGVPSKMRRSSRRSSTSKEHVQFSSLSVRPKEEECWFTPGVPRPMETTSKDDYRDESRRVPLHIQASGKYRASTMSSRPRSESIVSVGGLDGVGMISSAMKVREKTSPGHSAGAGRYLGARSRKVSRPEWQNDIVEQSPADIKHRRRSLRVGESSLDVIEQTMRFGPKDMVSAGQTAHHRDQSVGGEAMCLDVDQRSSAFYEKDRRRVAGWSRIEEEEPLSLSKVDQRQLLSHRSTQRADMDGVRRGVDGDMEPHSVDDYIEYDSTSTHFRSGQRGGAAMVRGERRDSSSRETRRMRDERDGDSSTTTQQIPSLPTRHISPSQQVSVTNVPSPRHQETPIQHAPVHNVQRHVLQDSATSGTHHDLSESTYAGQGREAMRMWAEQARKPMQPDRSKRESPPEQYRHAASSDYSSSGQYQPRDISEGMILRSSFVHQSSSKRSDAIGRKRGSRRESSSEGGVVPTSPISSARGGPGMRDGDSKLGRRIEESSSSHLGMIEDPPVHTVRWEKTTGQLEPYNPTTRMGNISSEEEDSEQESAGSSLGADELRQTFLKFFQK